MHLYFSGCKMGSYGLGIGIKLGWALVKNQEAYATHLCAKTFLRSAGSVLQRQFERKEWQLQSEMSAGNSWGIRWLLRCHLTKYDQPCLAAGLLGFCLKLASCKLFFSSLSEILTMAYINTEYTLNTFSTKSLTTYSGISNWTYLLWGSFPGFCAIPTPRNSLFVDKTMEMLTTICQRNSSPRFTFWRYHS